MNRHPLDPVSFLFGLAFTAFGLVTLAASEVPLAWLDPRVVFPAVAVTVGIWMLVTAFRRGAGAADGDGG